MKCRVSELYSLEDYRFVVLLSFYQGRMVLSRHRERSTWETQGGHIEEGETPEQAARRELYEESGAQQYTLRPLFDYWAGDEAQGASGRVFRADIESFSAMPPSEMEEISFFEDLPPNLTYPDITPLLFQRERLLSAREVWDAYDMHGNKLGFDLYRDEDQNIPQGVYHMVVEILPVSENGEVLITKRHPEKRFPLMWETSGGAVLKGETSLQGAMRELLEETGLKLPGESFQLLERYTCPGYSGYFCRYLARFHKESVTIRLQESETIDYQLLPWEVFWQKIQEADFVPVLREKLLPRREFLEAAVFGK